MPILVLRRFAREGARLAVPVLLAASLTMAARTRGAECECIQCPPFEDGYVLIGYLSEPTEPATELQTVEVLFEPLGAGDPEAYTLKVFELDQTEDDAPLCLQSPQLVGEQPLVVANGLPVPPATARWELAVLEPSIWTGPGNRLFAVETTREHLLDSLTRPLFAEATSWERARTYFSLDGGFQWCPLSEVELTYLLGDESACLLDDSIYIKIHVKPN